MLLRHYRSYAATKSKMLRDRRGPGVRSQFMYYQLRNTLSGGLGAGPAQREVVKMKKKIFSYWASSTP